MRAMVIDGFGGADLLRIADISKPVPSAGEVLVRVACAGVNPADWKTRNGMLSKYIDYHFPFVLGFDLSGIVDAVGPGVTQFAPGDRVFGTSMQGAGKNGSYAEYALADPAMLQPLPANLSFAQAAALPVAGDTAYGAIVDVGTVQAGQKVLINGGAGGVGSIGTQIAHALGAHVAVTCSPPNNDYVRMLGAEAAFDYHDGTESLVAQVREWAPGGVDLVIDAVGMGSLSSNAHRLVREGGIYVEIETLFAEASDTAKAQAAEHGVRLVSNMIAISRLPDHLRGVASMAASDAIRIEELSILPLEQAGDAHLQLESGHVRGKIVLDVSAGDMLT